MKENTTEQVSTTETHKATTKSFRDESKKPAKKSINLHQLRERDSKPVKGLFKYYEVPNGVLEFSYKAYDQDPVVLYQLYDGVVYTLPYGVAKHINKNLCYPVHEYRVEEQGKAASQIIGKRVSRAAFQHLEFFDIEDLNAAGTPEIEIVSMAKI